MPKPMRPRAADVEINASARAKRLKVRQPAEVTERQVAEPSGETAAGSDRQKLPDQVRAGGTYHDIRIDYRLASRLATEDDDRGGSK